MTRKHPYFGEPVDPRLVSSVAAHHWAAVRLPTIHNPPFLSHLKRGTHLYTLASGSQLEPVFLEIDGWAFEVVMGMTRYRDDPFDMLPINVDEYQVFKVVIDSGGLCVVNYRAVVQVPGPSHWLSVVPQRVLQAPELTL